MILRWLMAFIILISCLISNVLILWGEFRFRSLTWIFLPRSLFQCSPRLLACRHAREWAEVKHKICIKNTKILNKIFEIFCIQINIRTDSSIFESNILNNPKTLSEKWIFYFVDSRPSNKLAVIGKSKGNLKPGANSSRVLIDHVTKRLTRLNIFTTALLRTENFKLLGVTNWLSANLKKIRALGLYCSNFYVTLIVITLILVSLWSSGWVYSWTGLLVAEVIIRVGYRWWHFDNICGSHHQTLMFTSSQLWLPDRMSKQPSLSSTVLFRSYSPLRSYRFLNLLCPDFSYFSVLWELCSAEDKVFLI